MANHISSIYSDQGRWLDTQGAAVMLGISTATVRNWVKTGYLQTVADTNLFDSKNIKELKNKITTGEVGKLNKRANKSKSNNTFVPDEYLNDSTDVRGVEAIVNYVKTSNITTSSALLVVALNLLLKDGLIETVSLDTLRGIEFVCANNQLKKEILAWVAETEINRNHVFLLNCELPNSGDVLGFIYQSLLVEGNKSQTGSYYTPRNVVNDVVKEYVREDSKVLDPCCGTGQYLISFSEVVKDPRNIYGIDVDSIATRIARINLLMKFRDQDFSPNIVCKNTLLEIGNYDLFSLDDESVKDFDVIATNPPWGLHFSKEETGKLEKIYQNITSQESFSYFLIKGIELLKDGGILSFILPESILNVKTHKDIRDFLLNNSSINKVVYLDRVFKNVFTPVIRLDLKKSKESKNTEIVKDGQIHSIKQNRWLGNVNYVFDIHSNESDIEILNKIYNLQHTTLKNQAEWALGIVTGNNHKFIRPNPEDGYEEIYRGKDVDRFILKQPTSYIRFTPEEFQQVAPIEKYRASEKLIYKFISKRLVFAYDEQQKLTLNSANIVIPKIINYPLKVIAALFNSLPYQYIFLKKFSSIKVLRNHIEDLPLPNWETYVFSDIIRMVDRIIGKTEDSELLDDYIMDRLLLSSNEKTYIKSIIQ